MPTKLIRANGDSIVIDSTVKITKAFPNVVTQHPIEDGSVVTDHIVTNPRTFSIDGIISDAAFTLIADDAIPLGIGRSAAATIAVESMADGREIIILETQSEIFEDVVITNLTIPRDAKTGEALRFSMNLQQIRTVERRFVTVPRAQTTSKDAAQENAETGRQATKRCDGNRDRSALAQVVDSGKSLFNNQDAQDELIENILCSPIASGIGQ